MDPALFVFTDEETSSCIYVHQCDAEMAKTMITRTISSNVCTPVSSYDPLEFATVFVAANKSKPYDMLFVGELDEEELEDGDINVIYEIAPSHLFPDALDVVPIDMRDTRPSNMWVMRQRVLH